MDLVSDLPLAAWHHSTTLALSLRARAWAKRRRLAAAAAAWLAGLQLAGQRMPKTRRAWALALLHATYFSQYFTSLFLRNGSALAGYQQGAPLRVPAGY